MTSQRTALAAAGAWARLVAVLGSRVYRSWLLTLSAIAIAPLLLGWGSFVIKSGSMEPSIEVGDVVVARPFAEGEKVAVGRVYVFDDPGTAKEHRLTHRIVARNDDGTYTSAGDANEVTDATPVTAADIEARAVTLAPYVGLPVAWIQAGEWVKLGLWLLLTIAAFATATRNLPGEPPKWNLLRLLRDRRRRRNRPDPAPAAAPGPHDKVLVRRRSRVPAVLGVGMALVATQMGSTNATFTAQTRSSGSTWTAGNWTQPYVSAVLTDRPESLWLLDEAAGAVTAQDRSGNTTLGSYKPAAVLGQAGGLPNNTGTSIRTSGGLALTGTYATGAPTTHTVEFWVRTSSTAGGHLAGFGSSATTGTPTIEDRVTRMTPSGRITYGDWSTNQVSVIATPAAYNDGAWHHVVVVSAAASGGRQNTTIHVDGVARVSGQTSKVDNYTGYVRVGGGFGYAAFNGSIDNVSVYGTALPASRVSAHWNAR